MQEWTLVLAVHGTLWSSILRWPRVVAEHGGFCGMISAIRCCLRTCQFATASYGVWAILVDTVHLKWWIIVELVRLILVSPLL